MGREVFVIDLPQKLFSERLMVRSPLPGDGPLLNSGVLESLKELRPWMPWAKEAPSLEISEKVVRAGYAEFVARSDLMMLFFEKKSGEFLGGTGLHRIDWKVPKFEIGYWQRTSQCGKGYVTEVVNLLTRFSFEFLKARRVEIRFDPENVKSVAVAERLGFSKEGHLRNDRLSTSGELRDTLIYARLGTEGLPPLKVSWE